MNGFLTQWSFHRVQEHPTRSLDEEVTTFRSWRSHVVKPSQPDLNCEAPNLAPNGVSSEGVTFRYWDSLTFAFSELTLVPVFSFICTISVITKILLHIHYKYHRSGIHVLYTESHYFSIYKTYTYSKNTEISEAVR